MLERRGRRLFSILAEQLQESRGSGPVTGELSGLTRVSLWTRASWTRLVL